MNSVNDWDKVEQQLLSIAQSIRSTYRFSAFNINYLCKLIKYLIKTFHSVASNLYMQLTAKFQQIKAEKEK